MIFNITQHKKGFTLVETLVAISILLIAVVGPMSLIGNSLSQIYIARDQIVAINLAQEGIEGARQIHNSTLLARWTSGTTAAGYNTATASPVWTSGITVGPPSPNCDTNQCILEVGAMPALSACTGVCTGKLYMTPQGIFTHVSAGNTITPFTRLITATVINANEITVNSTVTWNASNGTPKTVTIGGNFFGINN